MTRRMLFSGDAEALDSTFRAREIPILITPVKVIRTQNRNEIHAPLAYVMKSKLLEFKRRISGIIQSFSIS
ncbi:MAG: hypothetical protein ACFFE6_11475 [Candidatus Thorarchaeota archaeon]